MSEAYPEQKRLFQAVLEMLRIRNGRKLECFGVPFFFDFLFFPHREQWVSGVSSKYLWMLNAIDWMFLRTWMLVTRSTARVNDMAIVQVKVLIDSI